MQYCFAFYRGSEKDLKLKIVREARSRVTSDVPVVENTRAFFKKSKLPVFLLNKQLPAINCVIQGASKKHLLYTLEMSSSKRLSSNQGPSPNEIS